MRLYGVVAVYLDGVSANGALHNVARRLMGELGAAFWAFIQQVGQALGVALFTPEILLRRFLILHIVKSKPGGKALFYFGDG